MEWSIVLAGVVVFVAFATWTFAGFISGRLTNSLLVLGLFALFGAFHAFRPLGREKPAPRAPAGWRWRVRLAGDLLYYAGPAWILAVLYAMRSLDALSYALPFASALAGGLTATAVAHRRRHVLPGHPPVKGPSVPPVMRGLAAAYAVVAALMLAGNVGLV